MHFLKLHCKQKLEFSISYGSHCLKITQMSHLNFGIFHQFWVLLKLTCLVTLFDRKL